VPPVPAAKPSARPGAVADDDPGTTWYATEEDREPWLRLAWPARREVTGIRMTLTLGTAATQPTKVTVIGDGDIRDGLLDANGVLALTPPIVTSRLTVLIADSSSATSYDPYRNMRRFLPVGVSELTALPERKADPDPAAGRVDRGCGSGPQVTVAGTVRRTALVASRRDLLQLREVDAVVCSTDARRPLRVGAGETHLVATASALAVPVQVALTPRGATPARTGAQQARGTVRKDAVTTSVKVPVRVDAWSATQRRLYLDPYAGPRVLALRENANPGWSATIDGEKLPVVKVDGWQQAWLVPDGASGEVVLRFQPDRIYTVLMGGGALLLAAVAVLAVRGSRQPAAPVAGGVRGRRRLLVPALFGGVALLLAGGVAAAGLALITAGAVLMLRQLRPYFGAYDRRRLSRLSLLVDWLLPVGLFVIAGWLAVLIGGHTAALPQLTALGCVVLLWLSVLLGRGVRGQRWLKR